MSPGPDQESVPDLKRLAHERFGNLTAAEIKLLNLAPKGEFAVCGPNSNYGDPANDPAQAESWGPDRQIRPGLIRWLCVDRQAKELVDPNGIQAYGAKITGALHLDFVAVPFPLTLWHCRLMDNLTLLDAEIPQLDLQGTWTHSLQADGVRINGNAFLRNGFLAEGEVRFLGAEIGGDLDCSKATIKNPFQPGVAASGSALNADRVVVKGSVILKNGFSAQGEVRFLGAQIQGDLVCSGSTFKNPPQPREEATGNALSADQAVVNGSVFLRQGFSAEAEVRLLGAQIGGNLECIGGSFTKLSAQGATIKGTLVWTEILNPEHAELDLTDATAGSIVDEEKSWPTSGNLSLHGFVYQRIRAGPRDAESRLNWLARQKSFTLQPYRQLSKVLTEEGDEDGARKVLVEMERRERATSWTSESWSWLLRWTIGYGYYPWRGIGGLMLLSGLGWIIFRRAHLAGAMTPTDEQAYRWHEGKHCPPPHYTPFSPLVYSLENSLPLVKFGQADRWQPDPNNVRSAGKGVSRFSRLVTSPKFLRGFLWAQILLGWILATLFAAGVTGIVHK